MHKFRVVTGAVLFVVLAFGVLAGSAWAQSNGASSNNYEITEPQFGAGSELDLCSGSYCARASIGKIGPDEVLPSSASFGQIPEDSDPLLEVIVDPGVSNLGVLSTTETASKTMVVRVRSYMSDGYTLQINGQSPKYDGYTLKTMVTPGASMPGTEQFGINLAANTAPAVGDSPIQLPSDIFSFGQALPDYAVPDLFKYIDGETVATSEVATGRTDYTVSMIVNISNATPAGHFSGDYSAIVVPLF